MRQQLLLDALRYYQNFVEQQRDNPQFRAELAATWLRIQALQFEVGQDWLPALQKISSGGRGNHWDASSR